MDDMTAGSTSEEPSVPEAPKGPTASEAAPSEPADPSRLSQVAVDLLNDAHKKSIDRLQALRVAIWLIGLLITLLFCGTLLYYAFRK